MSNTPFDFTMLTGFRLSGDPLVSQEDFYLQPDFLSQRFGPIVESVPRESISPYKIFFDFVNYDIWWVKHSIDQQALTTIFAKMADHYYFHYLVNLVT